MVDNMKQQTIEKIHDFITSKGGLMQSSNWDHACPVGKNNADRVKKWIEEGSKGVQVRIEEKQSNSETLVFSVFDPKRYLETLTQYKISV